jgi:hypothetical protein
VSLTQVFQVLPSVCLLETQLSSANAAELASESIAAMMSVLQCLIISSSFIAPARNRQVISQDGQEQKFAPISLSLTRRCAIPSHDRSRQYATEIQIDEICGICGHGVNETFGCLLGERTKRAIGRGIFQQTGRLFYLAFDPFRRLADRDVSVSPLLNPAPTRLPPSPLV